MRLSGCFRVMLGIFIAIALIGAGLYAVARYYQDKYGIAPEKPLFAEEQGKAFEPLQTRAPEPPPEAKPASAAKPTATPTPKPSPTPVPKGDKAVVVWPEGLIVRSSAAVEGEQIGGIEYNREVYILESTEGWQKIKVANGDLEGWVRAGNLEVVKGQ